MQFESLHFSSVWRKEEKEEEEEEEKPTSIFFLRQELCQLSPLNNCHSQN